MTTASDDADRACPLCMEEMDLTDQQLKACKCGYEICLLCWHHLIEIAEKDETEGRCPACRTPYDKERILGMGAKCERVIAEMNAKKKQKSQKAKTKTSADAKKHLSTVRVIQRNLVYIIGLPSNLCDESILERKEYFGQYGKVLKVSVSRPAGTTSQQTSTNTTFNVYITYAKEEEAIRCIQAVHNYTLDGKSLRACFGTTKYCHAWLRNMPCSNPDCLYLHDIGNQEDSFTKDEIISAYTRSRIPQIASNASQRRAGDVLPPPVDDFNSGSTNQVKSLLNGTSTQVKVLPPNVSTGQSVMLPAAASWGLKGVNCRPSPASVACPPMCTIDHKVDRTNHSSLSTLLDDSTKQSSAWHEEIVTASKVQESRTHMVNNSPVTSFLAECSKQPSAWNDEVVTTPKLPKSGDRMQISGISQPNEPLKIGSWNDSRLTESLQVNLDGDCASRSSAWDDDTVVRSKVGDERCTPYLDGRHRPVDPLMPVTEKSRTSVSDSSLDISEIRRTSDTSSSLPSLSSAPKDSERGISIDANGKIQIINPMSKVLHRQSSAAGPDQVIQGSTTSEGINQGLCLPMSSVRIDSHDRADQLNVDYHLADSSVYSSEIPRSQDSDPSLAALSKDSLLFDQLGKSELTDHISKSLNPGSIPETNGTDDPLLHCDNQGLRLSDADYNLSSSPCLNFSHSVNHFQSTSNDKVGCNEPSFAVRDMNRMLESMLSPKEKVSSLSSGYKEDELNGFSLARKVFEYPELNCAEENVKSLGTVGDISKHNKSVTATVDIAGESSIISDILSLDFDPWDDSLFSADKFTRLLGETDKQERSFNLSSSQNSNQSRFSFARQESQTNNLELPVKEKNHAQKYFSLQNEYQDSFANGATFNSFDGPNTSINGSMIISSDKSAGIAKVKVSAPPGFSAPSRVAPPPGFPSQDRFNQSYETAYSEYRPHGNSSVGNHYQAHLIGNPGDVEFIDPAIMAVGKGRMPVGVNNSALSSKSSFPAQLNASDSDPRLHLLMQQSVAPHQNLRIPDHLADRFLPLNDAYIASRLLAQNHGGNISAFEHMLLQQQRNSHFTNSQWDGWNSFRAGNDVGISEILLNERFGINNYYSGNEENKFRIPNGDIYSRAFGM